MKNREISRSESSCPHDTRNLRSSYGLSNSQIGASWQFQAAAAYGSEDLAPPQAKDLRAPSCPSKIPREEVLQPRRSRLQVAGLRGLRVRAGARGGRATRRRSWRRRPEAVARETSGRESCPAGKRIRQCFCRGGCL